MKKILISTVAAITLVGGLVACNKKEEKAETIVDTNQILFDKSLTIEQAAEKLAKAGEQLLMGSTLHHAESVFKQALAMDANNMRAQFHLALIKVGTLNKGILKRIRPFIKDIVINGEKELESHDQLINAIKPKHLRDFLIDGTEDIKNEKDMQLYIDSVTNALEELRTFAKKNVSLKLTVSLSEQLRKARESNALDADFICKFEEVEKGIYFAPCDTELSDIEIGAAEMVGLRHFAAAQIINFAHMNAWDAQGLRKMRDKTLNMTQVEKLSVFNNAPEFQNIGKLRKENRLSSVLELGADAAVAVKWAEQNKESFCKTGTRNQNNRPGYVLDKGLCANLDLDIRKVDPNTNTPIPDVNGVNTRADAVAFFEALISMSRVVNLKNKLSEVRAVKVDVPKFYANPIKDLRSIAPTNFDALENPWGSVDQSFNGLLPNKDFNEIEQFLRKKK